MQTILVEIKRANTAFIEAIKNAENDATLSFPEARNQWKKQKTRLQKQVK